MKNLRKIIFFLRGLALLLFAALCTYSAYSIYYSIAEPYRFKNADSFYRTYSDFDAIRFPLIKPFEAEKVDNTNLGWFIHLGDIEGDIGTSNSVLNIERLAVEKDVILAYTSKNDLLNVEGDVIFHWFVIDPNKKETGFSMEKSFLLFISDYGIKKPKWQDPDVIFQEFRQSGCLDWVPDCHP